MKQSNLLLIAGLTCCVLFLFVSALQPKQETNSELPVEVTSTTETPSSANKPSSITGPLQTAPSRELIPDTEQDDDSLCNNLCQQNSLDLLVNGIPLSNEDYRKLTHDMSALVTYLSNSPSTVEALAIKVSWDFEESENEVAQPILHILKQLPYETLSYIASDLLFAPADQSQASALTLIDLAYKANVSDNAYANKEDLRSTLESYIYTETSLSNKLNAFDILADHEWQNTDVNHLKTIEAAFEQDLDEKTKAKALETVAIFGGQVNGFEGTLVQALTSESNQMKTSALSAINKLAVFIDQDDPNQTELLARLEQPLRNIIKQEPDKSYYAYKINKLLEKHFQGSTN